MPSEQAGNDKQDQDQAGDDHKMSSGQNFSTNTSSPIPEVSGSPVVNGNGSEPTHTEPEESPGSLLNFPPRGSFSTSPSLDPEVDREFTLTLHMSTFGKERQLHQSIASLLHHMTVSGHHVIAAVLNAEDVTERYYDDRERRWDHPQFKGFIPDDLT